MPNVSTLRRALATSTAALLLLVVALPARAAAPDFAFSDPRIDAPSGIATDAGRQVYWTTNETAAGSSAVFAVKPDGTTAARYVLNTPARSVQAVAYDANRVFVGDIGDPQRTRASVVVSMFTVATLSNQTTAFRQWDLTFPDGAQDGQALLLGANTQLYVVSAAGGVYKAPTTLSTAAVTRSASVNRMQKVADVPSGVSDGFMTASHVYLRTATEVVICDPTTFAVQTRATLPQQKDGKGITSSLTQGQLLLTGRGAGSEVISMADPTVPTPSATPTPEATNSTAGTGNATPTTEPRADRTGTLVAVSLAVLLALVAAGVTFFRR